MSTPSPDSSSASPSDRRSNPELRPLFERAYEVIRPFFDDKNSWSTGQGHQMLAFRALRESFPELSQEQVFIIVAAAQRVFASGGHIAPP